MGLHGLSLAVEPEDLATSLRRLDEPQQQADGGRLACSVGTQVPDDLARGDFEVEVVEGGGTAIALGQTLRADGRSHRRTTSLTSITDMSVRFLPRCLVLRGRSVREAREPISNVIGRDAGGSLSIAGMTRGDARGITTRRSRCPDVPKPLCRYRARALS